MALALVVLMVLTRFGHFGELSRLPDASWAVFFVGGLLLREARAFAAFFGLAWIVDLASFASGTPVDCFSLAYLFLVPAYGLLWFAGRRAASWLQPSGASDGTVATRPVAAVTVSLALAAGVTAAFVVSNAGFWAFGAGFSPMGATEYAARVAGYLPGTCSRPRSTWPRRSARRPSPRASSARRNRGPDGARGAGARRSTRSCASTGTP